MSDILLSADDVGRRFGYRQVFSAVTLALRRGETLALMGPNGAGKTTLLRVLSGLLKPSSGTVARHGTLGFVAHHSMAYDALTARENLAFAARLWGITNTTRADELLDQVGLARWRDQRVATYSRGMTQRLAIARALMHDPDVLLLDEPLNSLDEPGTEMVLQFMEDFAARGHAIAIVTHQFERIARVATSVGYLVGGSLDGPETVDGRRPHAVSEKYRSLLAHA
ncbi:MAG: ABC transporter ATP-binding protein [Gemmatimonadetes bacterium]|nr:ABC transporter ATP-binding protein [Gemmatimonadota bacterium]